MIMRDKLSVQLHVLRDPDIRLLLRAYFDAHHPNVVVIDELPIHHHATRADIVVVGESTLDAYEIKSDVDNMQRFEDQHSVYESIFDSVTIVTTGRHHAKAVATIPASVGVITVDGLQSIVIQREPRSRPQPKISDVLGLLTRVELQLICRLNVLPARDPYRASYAWRIMQGCTHDEVRFLVRETLRSRYTKHDVTADQNPPRICLDATSMWWATPIAVQNRF
jgi:hypothetical protein